MKHALRSAAAALVAVAVAAAVAWAAASYPVSVKSFTTKATGEVIQAAHVNDLQDEVVAIEQALLTTGFEHALKPKTTGTYDLGTSTLGWQQLFLDLGTITADTQAIDIKGTWNAAAVAFTALKLNITDTASATASLLEQLQIGGVNRRTLRKDGLMTLAGSGAGLDLTAGAASRIGTTDAFDFILKRAGIDQVTLGSSGVGIAAGTLTPAARLHVKEASLAEIARLEGAGQGSLTFFDGATDRGRLGFGSAGNIFSAALTNSVGLRSEGALHLGVGSTVILTIREIGYAPGTGYIAVGGHTDPLSVFEVGGEASPELGIRSNTTGLRYTLQSNSDKTFRMIDRSNGVDRLVVGDPQSLGVDGIRALPNMDGMLIIIDHTGAFVGTFFLRKSTASQEINDPSAAFSPTKDTAGTINVYWDTTNARFEIQNKIGSTRTISFWLLGKS